MEAVQLCHNIFGNSACVMHCRHAEDAIIRLNIKNHSENSLFSHNYDLLNISKTRPFFKILYDDLPVLL